MKKVMRCIYEAENDEIGWKYFNMNSRYLILYSEERLGVLHLNKIHDDYPEITTLNLKIDCEQLGHKIIRVQPGENEELVAIVVQRSEENFTVLAWDLSLDYELSSFDVEAPFIVQLDHDGNAYVIHKGTVSFASENCSLNVFSFDDEDLRKLYEKDLKNRSNRMEFGYLSLSRGHRVDGKNHNWVLFDDYLALPFSYMSFVIKDKIERKRDRFKVFDPEPYTYLFNRSTAFIDGLFVRDDEDQLSYVLRNLKRLDQKYLGLLVYYKVLDSGEQDRKELKKAWKSLVAQINVKEK